MPRRRSQSTKRALVLGVGAVLFGLALLVGLSFAAGSGKVDVSNLGDRDFRVGRTDALANEISRRGPFLVADASPHQARDIYVQHVGSALDKGWLAIGAGTRGCTLQWDGSRFRDPCTHATYPSDGTGLVRYQTRVDGVALYVDLRATTP